MKIIILFLILLTHNIQASESSGLIFSPIIGVERIQKFHPPTMKSRAIFGARGEYVMPIFSLEAEYTHGQDSSTDSTVTPVTTYDDSEDKIKLGLKGNTSFDQFVSVYIRGGAQLKQNKETKTISGQSSSTSSQSKVQPYVGTGIGLHVLNYFSLNADLTAVYAPTNTLGLSDFELAPSIGFSVGI
jgi:hypothetical protein